MTRIIIKELILNEDNLEHISKHNVIKKEVIEVGNSFTYHRRTYSSRYLVIGRSGLRIITLVLRRESVGKYYLVTARDSDRKERRTIYEREKK